MGDKRIYSQQYMLYSDDDGLFLMNQWGFKAPLEEVEDITCKLLQYARTHVLEIDANNRHAEEYPYGEPRQNSHKEKSLPKKRYVYLMECGGKYKVGISENIERRVKELNNKPFPTRLVTHSDMVHCAYEAEREIHEWLDEYRIGGEWFDIPESFVHSVVETIADIDDVIYGYGEE